MTSFTFQSKPQPIARKAKNILLAPPTGTIKLLGLKYILKKQTKKPSANIYSHTFHKFILGGTFWWLGHFCVQTWRNLARQQNSRLLTAEHSFRLTLDLQDLFLKWYFVCCQGSLTHHVPSDPQKGAFCKRTLAIEMTKHFLYMLVCRPNWKLPFNCLHTLFS